MRVLGIDPGRGKSGIAVADGRTILAKAVVPVDHLEATLLEWSRRFEVETIVIGDRTGRPEIQRLLAGVLPGVPVATVSEAHTTLLARRRYFADHPRRGWRRLLPISLQVPPEAYDDYAAVIILERYLGQKISKR